MSDNWIIMNVNVLLYNRLILLVVVEIWIKMGGCDQWVGQLVDPEKLK